MAFSSITFICIFLPAVFLLYQLMPGMKSKNILLMIASVLFYGFGEMRYLLLLVFSILWNWGMALWIARVKGSIREKQAKSILAACLVVDFAMLGIYKYSGLGLLLPVGISFYTFQMASYVVDVYRQPEQVQRDIGKLTLYISFFPQLIAGPIVKYHEFREQIEHRRTNIRSVAEGLRRVIYGLAKKMLLANAFAEVTDLVFGLKGVELSAPLAWLGAFTYLMQIYFDFSGYSDMAVGLGRIFGFSLPENFRYPYISGSIREFWRRWHITLSSWLRDYVYIPLGGNRTGHAMRNQMIVFLLSGIWHGAGATFLVWGLWHGAFVALETVWQKRHGEKKDRWYSHLYALLVIMIGFVIFRAETLPAAGQYLWTMLTGWQGIGSVSSPAWILFVSQLTPYFLTLSVVAVIACLPLREWLWDYFGRGSRGRKLLERVAYVCSLFLLMLSIAALAAGTYNPFIYFRF